MSELKETIKYKSSTSTGTITLYSNTDDINKPYIYMNINNTNAYIPLGEITDENASPLRVSTSDNKIYAILKSYTKTNTDTTDTDTTDTDTTSTVQAYYLATLAKTDSSAEMAYYVWSGTGDIVTFNSSYIGTVTATIVQNGNSYIINVALDLTQSSNIKSITGTINDTEVTFTNNTASINSSSKPDINTVYGTLVITYQ